MPKKNLPTTIEGFNDELEQTQKQIRQLENRNKMLERKIFAEKRRERNHRIYFYGGFLDGIVPELKKPEAADAGRKAHDVAGQPVYPHV